jgi:hypothetical protein
MTVTAFSSRRRLGPYQIVELLGAGGMGEVYRARDSRLRRDVAVKVLPTGYGDDPELLERLVREARAVGQLNHPNIVAIYDIGTQDGAEYVVMELLEGETLGHKLASGPLSPQTALDYATQIARGLTAAHEKNIVHRDLKPDNIFITHDGRVKILDFGLAREARGEDVVLARISSRLTMPGMAVGTAAYMSPEQARGLPVDHRSDIFSFGVTLYEMLSGKLPFEKETVFETMTAIINGQPSDLKELVSDLPPVLYRVVSHCLEKSPDARFQSARDLVFDLENCSTLGWSAVIPAPAQSQPRQFRVGATAAAIAVILSTIAALALWRLREATPEPSFHRLTFRQALIQAARFTADGQTVVYSASMKGQPLKVHVLRTDRPESQPVAAPSGELAAISRAGEMGIILNSHPFDWTTGGVLAQLPVLGGTPREIVDGVMKADWSQDGRLAVWRRTHDGVQQLEYPLGHVLYSSPKTVYALRVSPSGNHVAINIISEGQKTDIMVFGLDGSRRTLANAEAFVRGMAWTPDGKEVWFSTPGQAEQVLTLFGVTLDGQVRPILHAPAWPWLHDISRDGTVLMGLTHYQAGIMVPTDEEGKERDLSWLDASILADISPDGKTVLFTEAKDAVQYRPTVFMRSTDESPAVRLGEGVAVAFSPRKDKVLALRAASKRRELILLPTGAGPTETLPNDLDCLWGGFLPDGRIVIAAQTAEGPRMFLQARDGTPPQPLTPPGMAIGLIGPSGGGAGAVKPISPDGKSLLVFDRDRRAWIVSLGSGGERLGLRPAKGVLPEELPAGWSGDGRHVYVYRILEMPNKIYDVNLDTGERRLLREISAPDPDGVFRIIPILLMPDGHSFAYGYVRHISMLYTATGLR